MIQVGNFLGGKEERDIDCSYRLSSPLFFCVRVCLNVGVAEFIFMYL